MSFRQQQCGVLLEHEGQESDELTSSIRHIDSVTTTTTHMRSHDPPALHSHIEDSSWMSLMVSASKSASNQKRVRQSVVPTAPTLAIQEDTDDIYVRVELGRFYSSFIFFFLSSFLFLTIFRFFPPYFFLLFPFHFFSYRSIFLSFMSNMKSLTSIFSFN